MRGIIHEVRHVATLRHYICRCRDGYAPEMYQLGGFYTRCLSSGYSPGLSSLVQCTGPLPHLSPDHYHLAMFGTKIEKVDSLIYRAEGPV